MFFFQDDVLTTIFVRLTEKQTWFCAYSFRFIELHNIFFVLCKLLCECIVRTWCKCLQVVLDDQFYDVE